jgi:SNF2 family DNA or RNA helicase
MLLVKDIIGKSESRLQVELHDGRTPVLMRKYVYGIQEVKGGTVILAPTWYVGKMLGLPLYKAPKGDPPAMIDDLVCTPPRMLYRTEPWQHQAKAYHQSAKLKASFLNMAMGTGKSKVILDLAASRHAAGQVHKLVVVSPVNLKQNWYNQVKLHDPYDSAMHDRVMVFDERTSTTDRELLRWITEPGYGIAICGLESLSTEKFGGRAYNAALKLVRERRCMLVVDECHKIKGGSANRTQNTLSLGKWAPFRNVMTGTNITHSLGDLFHPYWLLDPRIIGYQRASEFERHHIITEPIEGTSRRRIVMYKNVEHVTDRIAPYTVQCTKDEALDLPDKLNKSRWAGLTVVQLRAYDQAKQELLGDRDMRDVLNENDVLRLFTALQQIVSGYWNHITYTWNPDLRIRERKEEFLQLVQWNENPKVKTLLEHAEACGTDQVLVWCKQRPELYDCVAALTTTYGADQVCQLHGDVQPKDRTTELERFRNGARFMVAMMSMGEGLNGLECSHQAVYYSNSFKYGERQQTEDRQHRPGQKNKVTYTDLWTPTGIDRIIQRCLGRKEDLSNWVQRALADSSGSMLAELFEVPPKGNVQ